MNVLLSILGTFIGCCTSVIFMEYAIRIDSGFGILVTFAQFTLIASIGFIFTSRLGRESLNVKYKHYIYLIVIFFMIHICNNYAYVLNVPFPLHMIIRSGSLIANMTLGILILKKRYTFSKYVSVLIISIGIFICTIVSGLNVNKTSKSHVMTENVSGKEKLFWWICGILLLTFGLFLSAGMGIYQEVLAKTYGKYPREALYVTHMLPLPGFLLLSQNIAEHIEIANASDAVTIPVINVLMPILWIYLILVISTQYLCINSVFILTTECTSLTVTLVVTLRKFVSLVFSIFYFNNPFTVYHWFGTLLVFFGTLIYTEVISSLVHLSGTVLKIRRKQFNENNNQTVSN